MKKESVHSDAKECFLRDQISSFRKEVCMKLAPMDALILEMKSLMTQG